jgi:hypothetical protein
VTPLYEATTHVQTLLLGRGVTVISAFT